MKRIGVDVDGVLADFNKGYYDMLLKTTGRNLFPEWPFDIPVWFWPEHFGYTKEEVDATWEYIKTNTMFWWLLEPYPETAVVLDQLFRLSDLHEIYFITTRMGVRPKYQTENWFIDNRFMFPTVLVSAHKGLSAAALDLDLYIDDKPSNCDDVIKARGMKTKVFLMDQPWNRDYSAKYVTRVSSVLDMLKEI